MAADFNPEILLICLVQSTVFSIGIKNFYGFHNQSAFFKAMEEDVTTSSC